MKYFEDFFNQRIVRFLLGGSLAAAFNLLLVYLMIEKLGFDTPLLRNLANIIGIEVSLLFSFFIYRFFVWTGGEWNLKEVLFRQLPLYHLSAGVAVIARIFIIFPTLDSLRVNYAVNTLIGILVSATLNYVISDRLVFKGSKSSDMYSPEGLEPSLEDTSRHIRSISNHSGLLSIVIPAYNEEGSIVETLESIVATLTAEGINYEILVVNDNSKDRTEEILQSLAAENSSVTYVNNYYPNGFGFAIRCGLENFKGDMVAIVMADSSDAPEDIVLYYHKLNEGYDCVFGSRFIKGGRVIDYPTHKLIINRMANKFVDLLFGLKFNDTTNAFKIYRREVIEGVSPLISHHFNLTVEIPLKAIARGYSFATVPITWRNRKAGISKLKIKEMGSRYLFIVLYIWLEKHLSRGDYARKHNQLAIQTKSRN
jgi:dolichol-phosphate mannosyltransferase